MMVMASTEKTEIAGVRDLLEALLRIETYRELEPEFKRSPKLRKLFELTWQATRAEIQKQVRLGTNVIAETWSSWQRRGLLRKRGKSYEKLWGD